MNVIEHSKNDSFNMRVVANKAIGKFIGKFNLSILFYEFIVDQFGGKNLNSIKHNYNTKEMILNDKNQLDSNVDLLPRPCFSYNVSHLFISFDDIFGLPRSSLFSNDLIEITIYKISSNENPYDPVTNKKMKKKLFKGNFEILHRETLKYFNYDNEDSIIAAIKGIQSVILEVSYLII